MKKILTVIPLLALTGCSMYAERFDCDPGKGVGCLALHKVDAQVDQKTLPFQIEEAQEKQLNQKKREAPQEDLANRLPEAESFDNSLGDPLMLNQAQRARLPEKALKVWVAPYEDLHGNFHESSVVHVVTQPGQWSPQ